MKALAPKHLGCSLVLGMLVYLSFSQTAAALAPDAPESATIQAPSARLLDQIGQLGDEAQAFLDRQDYEQAARRCKQAIALVEAERGTDDPLIEDPLTMLVDIYTAQDRPAELEATYLRLTPLFIRLHGEDNPATQSRMIDLVNFYREHERFADAIPWLQQLIASKGRSDGTDAPGIELMHLALAHCQFRVGRYAESETEYLRVIALISKAGTDRRKYTGIPMISLAEVYAADDKLTEAVATAKEAAAILAEGYGPDSSLACDARLRLGKILGRSGEAAQGKDRAQETACLKTTEKSTAQTARTTE